MDNKKKVKKFDRQLLQVKQASRLVFTGKPTKIKPSGKLYSRKKKELPGIFFFILPCLSLRKLHHS